MPSVSHDARSACDIGDPNKCHHGDQIMPGKGLLENVNQMASNALEGLMTAVEQAAAQGAEIVQMIIAILIGM